MAIVDLNVGGRQFQLACGDGDEPHLLKLAESLNARIKELSIDHEGSDKLLLVMTALMMQDEINEMNKKATGVANNNLNSQYLIKAADKINLLSGYVEQLAGKLEKC